MESRDSSAPRLDAEDTARLEAIQELLSVDRDWTGIVDDDKPPALARVCAKLRITSFCRRLSYLIPGLTR